MVVIVCLHSLGGNVLTDMGVNVLFGLAVAKLAYGFDQLVDDLFCVDSLIFGVQDFSGFLVQV